MKISLAYTYSTLEMQTENVLPCKVKPFSSDSVFNFIDPLSADCRDIYNNHMHSIMNGNHGHTKIQLKRIEYNGTSDKGHSE